MSGSGGLELLADLPCGHVTGLVRDGERLLATTEAPGRLIEIARDGGVSVLHEAAEGELREPLPMGDAVYFLANPVEPDAVGRLYRRSASGAVEQVWSAIAGSVYHLSAGRDGTLLVGGGLLAAMFLLERTVPTGTPITSAISS